MEACENMKQRRTWQEPPVAPAPQSPDVDPQGALTQARIKEQLLKDCMEMATLPAWPAVSRADVTTCLHPHLSCLFGPMQAAAGQSLGSWTEKPIYSSPSSSALRHRLAEHWALTIVRVHPFGLNQSPPLLTWSWISVIQYFHHDSPVGFIFKTAQHSFDISA